MFKEIIEKKRITFKDRIDSWQDAIRIAAKPLLDEGAIEESYITAMIDCVKEYGPYVVIAPDIAIPHARGEFGVNKTAISFMKVEEPVSFSSSSEHDARLFFVLASVGNNSHLELLQSLVCALSEDEIVNRLLESKTFEDLKEIFKC